MELDVVVLGTAHTEIKSIDCLEEITSFLPGLPPYSLPSLPPSLPTRISSLRSLNVPVILEFSGWVASKLHFWWSKLTPCPQPQGTK